jgi:ArsR family transcriptional regulator
MSQLPFAGERFDAATFHLVLHYAENPGAAVREAARFLDPGGRLVIVDFAPHEETSLQSEHGHRWLGFEDDEVDAWFNAAGLSPDRTVKLPGDPLTVCLWSATRDGAARRDGVEISRIEART